jgi:hypothetical protein
MPEGKLPKKSDRDFIKQLKLKRKMKLLRAVYEFNNTKLLKLMEEMGVLRKEMVQHLPSLSNFITILIITIGCPHQR